MTLGAYAVDKRHKLALRGDDLGGCMAIKTKHHLDPNRDNLPNTHVVGDFEGQFWR